MGALEELLAATREGAAAGALAAAAGARGDALAADLADELAAAPAARRAELYAALAPRAESAAADMRTEMREGEAGGEPSAEGKRARDELLLCALVAQVGYDCSTEASPPGPTLFALAQELHDNLLTSLERAPEVQEAISSLCEAWWANGTAGRDELVPQTVVYVIGRAIDVGRAADVKRCYAMRDALALFDFADPSTATIRHLLQLTMFAPGFLRSPDGRRFLSGLLHLDSGLVDELLQVVRNNILCGRKSLLDAYSDVLFRAWKGASGPSLKALENRVQDLMRACLHARTPSLATSLRRVLSAFHSKKKLRDVEALMARLWEPILFKSLTAANAAVRRNAVHALAEAFPLQDPSAKHEDAEALLQRQFNALSEALKDECPAVRVAAVEGTCRILDTYWEMMSAATAGALLATLVDELARDASSGPVRAAVAMGLAFLVEQPLAQPVLQKALPRCAHLLTDSNARARAAFAGVLKAVRGVRAIKSSEVVASEKLLARMARETDRTAAGALAEVLVPSFLPPSKPPAEAALRLVSLLESDAAAAAPFCKYAPAKGATPEAVGEALSLLAELLAEGPSDAPSDASKQAAKKAKGGKKKAKASAEAGDNSVRLPVELFAPAMEALAELASSARRHCRDALSSLDGALLAKALPHATDPVSRAALLRTAAALPPSAAEQALVKACGRVLSTPAPARSSQATEVGTPSAADAAWRDEALAILELTCSWGGVGDLAVALTETLQVAGTKHAKKGGGKRSKKAASDAEDGKSVDVLSACDAARYVEMLLQQKATRDELLDDADVAIELRQAVHGAALAALSQGEDSADLTVAAAKTALHCALGDVSDPAEAAEAMKELCTAAASAIAAAEVDDAGKSGRGGAALDRALDAAAAVLAVAGDAAPLGIVGDVELESSIAAAAAAAELAAAVKAVGGDADVGEDDWQGALAHLCAKHALRAAGETEAGAADGEATDAAPAVAAPSAAVEVVAS
eukprot:PRCOL_00006071-RA